MDNSSVEPCCDDRRLAAENADLLAFCDAPVPTTRDGRGTTFSAFLYRRNYGRRTSSNDTKGPFSAWKRTKQITGKSASEVEGKAWRCRARLEFKSNYMN